VRYRAQGRQAHEQTVETVEKSHFSKIIFEKWDKNIEKRLVFYVQAQIMTVFEPVVGDFFEFFTNEGFFDSFAGAFICKS
jgi:hypothetical protein